MTVRHEPADGITWQIPEAPTSVLWDPCDMQRQAFGKAPHLFVEQQARSPEIALRIVCPLMEKVS